MLEKDDGIDIQIISKKFSKAIIYLHDICTAIVGSMRLAEFIDFARAIKKHLWSRIPTPESAIQPGSNDEQIISFQKASGLRI